MYLKITMTTLFLVTPCMCDDFFVENEKDSARCKSHGERKALTWRKGFLIHKENGPSHSPRGVFSINFELEIQSKPICSQKETFTFAMMSVFPKYICYSSIIQLQLSL